MSNYVGTARTNYVRVQDIEGLRHSLLPTSINIEQHDEHPEYFMLYPESDDGGWPSFILVEDDDAEEYEDEFSFEQYVMPYVAEGEVLVAFEAGAEKLRYISGFAQAYCRRGNEVDSVYIGLNSIYNLAAEKFGVLPENIARCTYRDLPEEPVDAKAYLKARAKMR